MLRIFQGSAHLSQLVAESATMPGTGSVQMPVGENTDDIRHLLCDITMTC